MPVPSKKSSPSLSQTYALKGSKGFTLVELLIVVAIIGVLASIAIPAYHSYVDKAKIAVAIGTLDTIRKNFDGYHIDNQVYPVEPIDFDTGIDNLGRTAFSNMLLNQIKADITLVKYNTAIDNSGYTLIATAKDRNQTELTLTPTRITKAP